MTRKEILEKTIDFDDAIHRIVRLEKENANLKKSCDEIQELLDKQIEATYKLVEENAELKKQQFSLRNERNTFLAQNEQYEKDLIDFNENLTKAKELLNDFKRVLKVHNLYHNELYKRTEQFIKDSEVEK